MDPSTIRALELAKESSDRARSVLLFTQVACIIVFMAAWHELPNSWTFSRLRAAQAAAWYFDCGTKVHPEASLVPSLPRTALPANAILKAAAPDSNAAGAIPPHGSCHYLQKDEPYSDTSDPFTDDEIRQGKQFVGNWRMTPDQLKRHLQNLQDSFVNRTMNVSAPLLGFSFDLNDLGLIGGLSFLFLMMWLYFSMRREEDNVRLLFEDIDGALKAEVYKLACMTQVLTIPPEQREHKAKWWIGALRKASKGILKGTLLLLYATPFVVQSFVLWLDRDTWTNGSALNGGFVIDEFVSGCALGGLICVFTILCLYRSHQVDERWRKAHPKNMG